MEINKIKFAKVVEAARAKAAGHPEWLRAIEKAAAAILSGKMIVTTLQYGALVTTDGGTYEANGVCNCAARTKHCYHRAGARLMEIYEAEPDAAPEPEPILVAPEIVRSVEADYIARTGRKRKHIVVRCDNWMI